MVKGNFAKTFKSLYSTRLQERKIVTTVLNPHTSFLYVRFQVYITFMGVDQIVLELAEKYFGLKTQESRLRISNDLDLSSKGKNRKFSFTLWHQSSKKSTYPFSGPAPKKSLNF